MNTQSSARLGRPLLVLPTRTFASSSRARIAASACQRSAEEAREQQQLEEKDSSSAEDFDAVSADSDRTSASSLWASSSSTSRGENASRASSSLSRTAFVRSAEGKLPDIHAALSLARAVAFPRRDEQESTSSTSTSAAPADGGERKLESVLRDFSFAKSLEQRFYLGFGSFTFATPEALSAALRAQNTSVSPRKYFVAPRPEHQQAQLAQDPLVSGRSRSMTGLVDISGLVGLPREQIRRVLQSDGRKRGSAPEGSSSSGSKQAQEGVKASDEADEGEVEHGAVGGEWVEYKLERRSSVKTAKTRSRRPAHTPSHHSSSRSPPPSSTSAAE
ncbi:hypothetical protein OC835_003369 [Tilletia horrida]|nr:hypothetical protein OC835_003369 [Tilletia horrida]